VVIQTKQPLPDDKRVRKKQWPKPTAKNRPQARIRKAQARLPWTRKPFCFAQAFPVEGWTAKSGQPLR